MVSIKTKIAQIRKKKISLVTVEEIADVRKGISKKFSKDTTIIKNFPNWNGLNIPFEYYRRPL